MPLIEFFTNRTQQDPFFIDVHGSELVPEVRKQVDWARMGVHQLHSFDEGLSVAVFRRSCSQHRIVLHMLAGPSDQQSYRR